MRSSTRILVITSILSAYLVALSKSAHSSEDYDDVDRWKIKQSKQVLNATRKLSHAAAAGIFEKLQHLADSNLKLSRQSDNVFKSITNGSISAYDMVNFFPPMMESDMQQELKKQIKEFKKNSIRNAAILNNFLNELTEFFNTTDAKTLPKRFGIHPPATLPDIVSGYARHAFNSFRETATWLFGGRKSSFNDDVKAI